MNATLFLPWETTNSRTLLEAKKKTEIKHNDPRKEINLGEDLRGKFLLEMYKCN